MSNSRDSAIIGENVELSIQYYGTDGLPQDASEIPTITISNGEGTTFIAETSDGVTKKDTGLYSYTYYVKESLSKGVYEDTWSATIDGIELTNSFNFIVTSSSSAITGTVSLGDEVNFDFSEEELNGLNILLKYLKCRLRSNGKKPVRDEFGAFQYDSYGDMLYEECNVFSDEILACFLSQALSEFNMVPFFTYYSFADRLIFTTFSQLVVEGAYIVALASQSLLEKGRDFSISDGGISYQPPQLGDFLSSHYSNWLSNYRERLKFIKNNIRPGPVGYGTYTNLGSAAPAVTRLRHLRARRIV